MVVQRTVADSPDPVRLGGVGIWWPGRSKSGRDSKPAPSAGHLQRGGSPTATTASWRPATGIARRCWWRRANSAHGGPARRRHRDVPLEEAIAHLKTVAPDHPLILAARSIGTSFGD
jgi:6-phosphofructokinase 1